MGIASFLASLLPLSVRIRLAKEDKTSRFILDDTTFPKCHAKVVDNWSWVRFKNEKFVVHFCDDRFIIKKVK